MVAYSFKSRFVDPIKVGLNLAASTPDWIGPKRQTIRAVGKKRHAKPGELVHLYHAMRSPDCFLIGLGRCTNVRPIVLRFGRAATYRVIIGEERSRDIQVVVDLDAFAQRDGFEDWHELAAFWNNTHREKLVRLGGFKGLLIEWEPLVTAAEAA